MRSLFILTCAIIFIFLGFWLFNILAQDGPEYFFYNIKTFPGESQIFKQPLLWLTIKGILGFAYSILCIFSGIFLVLRKEWARTLCLGAAAIWILAGTLWFSRDDILPLPAVLSIICFICAHVVPGVVVAFILRHPKIKPQFK